MTVGNCFGMELKLKLDVDKLPRHFIEKIPYAFVRKHLIIPIEEKKEVLIVAMQDPLNVHALDELHLMLDRKIRAVLAPEEQILQLINICYNHEAGATSKLIGAMDTEGATHHKQELEEEVYDLLDVRREAPIVHLLNLILSEAIGQRASDIHFEPYENDLKIRYRIDGILQARSAPRPEFQAELLTRIKVLAKLDIAEHRLPQDGRIKLKMGGREIDFRVSTIPVGFGERIVLRILDQRNVSYGLSELNMLPHMATEFRRLISLTEGIVLVTGPTGSGKTTTLYSALSERSTEEVNIMTIEDPIEYKLKGIAQMAVHPKIGLSFATGLRHILRQDPDIVMIGEIRDLETAEIAIQASLTGHLVLSTLHTNDAPSAITRLVDMGIEPYLLSSTVVGIIAQRLVRKICPHCKESYSPQEIEIEEMGLQDLNLFYRGKGCSACYGSGYQGRQGIYELMTCNDFIQSKMTKNAQSGFLRELALTQGMTTLRASGAELVKSGLTTISEVLRVTRKV